MEGAHATVDAWATRRGGSLIVLLTNHALPRQPITTQRVHLELSDAPPPRSATLERIDDSHANAKAAWHALGEPDYLTTAQVQQLEEASRLVGEARSWTFEGRTAHFKVDLLPHAVAMLTIELSPQT